ncbi:hypothetical protein [Devosia ginsengisoli]|uniref:Uncharacterized protein n=1 Tax=Devosia ginsengisoli TaxID=400770 RepID=A0A5B8LR22_9HYPH|nr:hypothetical protein [Devosia ginsengisoli]QDZ10536.1 hypothetical protein FPZ08_07095 [Devosia ginsengisoli]
MRITAFIGAAVLGLCMLAFTPVAMADPAPNICALDLSQTVTVDHAIGTSDATCAVLAVDVAAVPLMLGDEDEAAGTCMTKSHAAVLDFAGHRQHEDPGRCVI